MRPIDNLKKEERLNKDQLDQGQKLAAWIAKQLDRKGGQDVQVLDVQGLSDVADYIVIATGTSSRHMQTLLDTPCKELKKLGFPPLSIEGEQTKWLLADLGDVTLHVFDDLTREHFDLEGLWQAAGQIDWTSSNGPQAVA